jgi:hypothetical protein
MCGRSLGQRPHSGDPAAILGAPLTQSRLWGVTPAQWVQEWGPVNERVLGRNPGAKPNSIAVQAKSNLVDKNKAHGSRVVKTGRSPLVNPRAVRPYGEPAIEGLTLRSPNGCRRLIGATITGRKPPTTGVAGFVKPGPRMGTVLVLVKPPTKF